LGAPDVSTTSEAPEGRGPQVSAVGAASNDGTSIIKTVHETDTTTTTGVTTFPMKGKAVVSGPTTMIGLTIRASSSVPGDDNKCR
jgi:hypothetical protein